MAWPTGQQVSTTNLSSSTANPSLARMDLNDAVVYLNAIIASKNEPEGACVLDGFGEISTYQIPNVIIVAGDLSLQPQSTVVNIRDTLRLEPKTLVEHGADTATHFAGDMKFVVDAVDGSGTGPAIIIYDGTDWKKLLLSGLGEL
jgi:hypothetical protein